MNLLNFIDDDLIKGIETDYSNWRVRHVVKSVLFNDKGQIALIYTGAYDVYKLPGGGFEEEEDMIAAFDREIIEETGCKAKRTHDLGVFIERRNERKTFQILYCFISEVLEAGEPHFDETEQQEGHSLIWADDIDKAIELISLNKSERYGDKYIRIRDLATLEKAKEILINN